MPIIRIGMGLEEIEHLHRERAIAQQRMRMSVNKAIPTPDPIAVIGSAQSAGNILRLHGVQHRARVGDARLYRRIGKRNSRILQALAIIGEQLIHFRRGGTAQRLHPFVETDAVRMAKDDAKCGGIIEGCRAQIMFEGIGIFEMQCMIAGHGHVGFRTHHLLSRKTLGQSEVALRFRRFLMPIRHDGLPHIAGGYSFLIDPFSRRFAHARGAVHLEKHRRNTSLEAIAQISIR